MAQPLVVSWSRRQYPPLDALRNQEKFSVPSVYDTHLNTERGGIVYCSRCTDLFLGSTECITIGKVFF